MKKLFTSMNVLSARHNSTKNPYRKSSAAVSPMITEGSASCNITADTSNNNSSNSNNNAIWIKCHSGYVINPHCVYMKRWDTVMVLLLIYTTIFTPFETAFLTSKLYDKLFFVNTFVDALFLKDLLLRFFVMYYDRNLHTWISNRRLISRNYLTGWFTLDAVSIIPFNTIGLLINSDALSNLKLARVLRLFRLLKLFRIVRGAAIFRRWETKMKIRYGILALLKFAMSVLIVAHWVACLFRVVVELEDNIDLESGERRNWMELYFDGDISLASQPVSHQYVAALYFSVMTMTTIGYGDIVPRTHWERVVAILSMLIGGSVYAYVVGGVCQVVTSLDASTATFQQTMDTLNEYMVQNQLPTELREKLRAYFQSSRVVQREQHFSKLLHSMSPGLRGEVSLFNHKWISKISFFCCGFKVEQDDFIIEVALHLKAAVFSPNELVIKRGEFNTQMYLIQKGIVGSPSRTYGGGACVGEDVILHLYRRKVSYRALSYLHVQVLHKQDLDRILSTGCFPETLKTIRRQVVKVAFTKKFAKLARKIQIQRTFTKETKPPHARSSEEMLQAVESSIAALSTEFKTQIETLRKEIEQKK